MTIDIDEYDRILKKIKPVLKPSDYFQYRWIEEKGDEP